MLPSFGRTQLLYGFVHFLVSGIYIGPHNQVFEFLLEF